MVAKKLYRKGADFERKLVLYLRERGFPYVCRSAGSKGVADVVAVTPSGKVWLIQCKAGKGKIGVAEVRELRDVALGCAAVPVVCTAAPKAWKSNFRFSLIQSPQVDSGVLTGNWRVPDFAA